MVPRSVFTGLHEVDEEEKRGHRIYNITSAERTQNESIERGRVENVHEECGVNE